MIKTNQTYIKVLDYSLLLFVLLGHGLLAQGYWEAYYFLVIASFIGVGLHWKTKLMGSFLVNCGLFIINLTGLWNNVLN